MMPSNFGFHPLGDRSAGSPPAAPSVAPTRAAAGDSPPPGPTPAAARFSFVIAIALGVIAFEIAIFAFALLFLR